MTAHTSSIYESEQLRAVTGPAIRPGGLTLTGRAMDYCQFPPEARLLDVGCGSGATVQYLRNHYELDASGVDVSTRLLEEGKTCDETLPLAHAGAENLPCGNATLDGILCECVLSLLNYPGQALLEFHRVLRPDGKLILSDIYLRGQRTGDREQLEENHLRQETLDGCLKGAMSARFTEMILSEAGFEVLLWEDHTPLLKELAARLILANCSMDALCESIKEKNVAASGPGYYLLVARKK